MSVPISVQIANPYKPERCWAGTGLHIEDLLLSTIYTGSHRDRDTRALIVFFASSVIGARENALARFNFLSRITRTILKASRLIGLVDCSSVYEAGTTSSVPGVGLLRVVMLSWMLSLTLAAGL